MKIYDITDDTPIAMLTVGQLRNVLSDLSEPQQQQSKEEAAKRYVFGIAGIKALFGVSHTTACEYKKTFLKEAVTQRGRKIVTDVDLAYKLFNEHKEGKR